MQAAVKKKRLSKNTGGTLAKAGRVVRGGGSSCVVHYLAAGLPRLGNAAFLLQCQVWSEPSVAAVQNGSHPTMRKLTGRVLSKHVVKRSRKP